MNFLDTITIATVGLTTIAVVFILLANLFEITKDTLSRMSIEDETIEDEAIEDETLEDEALDYDDKATQTDDEEPSIVESSISESIVESSISESIVESSISDAPSIIDAPSTIEDQKDPTIWYTNSDGKSRYKGEWKNGLPNGKGIKETFDTDTTQYSILDGNFVDGFAYGYGTQIFRITWNWEKTTPYYTGEFSRNEYHGFGEYHYGDYSYHKGEWRNHKMNGHGAYYSDILGKTWVGTFYDDKKGAGKWVSGEIKMSQ
jgi:hypothetical protein